MAYEYDSGYDLVSIDEILSRYLWNQKSRPKSSELDTDKWIRYAGAKGDPLVLDVNEYMKHGPGRFVSAYNFLFFQNFFSKHFDEGHYDFISMWNLIKGTKVDGKKGDLYINRGDQEKLKEIKKEYLIKSIYQYTNGIGSDDFITRAFIFGSTGFTFDTESIEFIVNSDGSKEIRGLKIYPVEDNFDFDAGRWYANLLNEMFESNIDPCKIGRTVPIKFTGEVPAITIKQLDFDYLNFQYEALKEIDSRATVMGAHASAYAKLKALIKSSPAINYLDNKGRKVIYDGEAYYHDGVVQGDSYDIDGMGMVFNTPGLALIGGGGEDILIGSENDDLLLAANSYSIE